MASFVPQVTPTYSADCSQLTFTDTTNYSLTECGKVTTQPVEFVKTRNLLVYDTDGKLIPSDAKPDIYCFSLLYTPGTSLVGDSGVPLVGTVVSITIGTCNFLYQMKESDYEDGVIVTDVLEKIFERIRGNQPFDLFNSCRYTFEAKYECLNECRLKITGAYPGEPLITQYSAQLEGSDVAAPITRSQLQIYQTNMISDTITIPITTDGVYCTRFSVVMNNQGYWAYQFPALNAIADVTESTLISLLFDLFTDGGYAFLSTMNSNEDGGNGFQDRALTFVQAINDLFYNQLGFQEWEVFATKISSTLISIYVSKANSKGWTDASLGINGIATPFTDVFSIPVTITEPTSTIQATETTYVAEQCNTVLCVLRCRLLNMKAEMIKSGCSDRSAIEQLELQIETIEQFSCLNDTEKARSIIKNALATTKSGYCGCS